MMQENVPFNWYGYRRFVKRSIIDDTKSGFVKNDTLIIRYQMDVVISSGGSVPELPRVDEDKIEVLDTLQSEVGGHVLAAV